MKHKDTFTENQRIIYEIAKEYLQKHPHFTKDELITVCKRASKLPDKEITMILEYFIHKKVFVAGSRLTSENVLKNEIRNQMCDYISKNPGTNFTQILNYYKIGPYEARWHLEMLKRFELIREQKFEKYSVYFHKNFPSDKDLIVFTLRNANVFRIYLCLKDQPFKVTDLSKILELHHSTVQYHLQKLQKVNLSKVNPDNLYSINTEFLHFLEQYYSFALIPELRTKINAYQETRKLAVGLAEEVIQVLRDYDYFGGNIRYKVAVQNSTKMTVSKIDILITATSQYALDDKVKTIDYLVPGETRGVDFILTPLQCGKSQVYATVAYTDGTGKPQSLVVQPKEVWIKCPLVSPQKVMENQIVEWKKNLQKGTSTIQFKSLSPKQVFEVAHNQIMALDLAEAIYDNTNFKCTFSGLAKVTSTKMMVEASIASDLLVLHVWADDMKQATGFLAYLRNLINVALESAQKLMGRVDQLGQKILNIFEIANRIRQLDEYSENLWIISEILIILREIKSRLNRIFPDLEITDQIANWIETLEKNFNVGDSIRENDGLRLQTSMQAWLGQIIRLTKSNIDNFNETFNEQETQITHFKSLLANLEKYNLELIEKIIRKILVHIIIIDKKSGLCLFNSNFQKAKADIDIMSGFLTAIQQFGAEFTQETTSVRKIEYHGFEINLENGQCIRAALILNGAAPEVLRKNLTTFTKEFEEKYTALVQQFRGDVTVFRDSQKLIEKYFQEKPYEEKTKENSPNPPVK
jgi:DNA-binding transcriptional ArsR family regulator